MTLKLIRNFIQLESFSGIILLTATLLALLIANSPWDITYQTFFNKKLLHIINDGLMSIFFLLVSLEIKRELINGELNSKSKALLPAFAAAGGVLFPALIYILFNYNHGSLFQGWAIPTATDIAFSLGILSLLGKRVPVSLKVFLTALAILDDLAAIIIIGVFYHQEIHFIFLLLAALSFSILLIFNYLRVTYISLYLLIGLIVWYCITKAGIHSTISGVLVGLSIPFQAKGKNLVSKLEEFLHPWVAYLILPLFAFANAGICFCNMTFADTFSTLSLGIIFGLLIGKPLGILLFSYSAIKFKFARLPSYTNWRHMTGLALICGVGFTMSIFIAMLAFPYSVNLLYSAKLGVLLGSLVSALSGYFILHSTQTREPLHY